MTRQQFEALILRFFGLTEALRSDASHEALRQELTTALLAWAGRPAAQDMTVYWTFADRLIAYAWGSSDGRKVWEIPWSRNADGAIEFGQPVEVKEVAVFEPVSESVKPSGKGQRFSEQIEQALTITEAQGSGARKVRAVGITADVVNGNRRRYPRAVLAAAVAGLNGHLHESAGQGRLIATGEVEHPSDKGGRPNLLETVVKWEAASLNSAGHVLLDGVILPTANGKDISVLVENGVPVGVSMRGYGSWEPVQENGATIQQVTELTITGFDLVSQPSDPNGRLTESQQEKKNVTLEELLELLKAKPELREALLNKLGLAEKAALAESLGVKPEQLQEALTAAAAAQTELQERKHKEVIDAAITEATKDLAYGDEINRQFVESVRQAAPADAAAVAAVVAAKRKEYDAIAAAAKLNSMGKGKVEVKGPVFEAQTGQPEFTAAAYQFTERLAERGYAQQRDLRQATKPSELFARRYLEFYDQAHKPHLIAEAKRLQEAETTADLALPYSFGRAIVAEVVPQLVALSVFDSGFADSTPSRVYYENYTPETGAQPSVVDEAVTAALAGWAALANKRLRPGTVVVKHTSGTPTYAEYTDYLIDYANGQIYARTGGAITNGQSLKVSYTYDLVRGGEMSPIQRGKGQLSFKTIELMADRLAQQISDEAVTFARTQIGWDATARTMAMIIREIREMIDAGIIRLALAQAHISGNSGGTWNSSSDAVDVLVQKIGVAKVAVQKKYYEPGAILMSLTNADRLSNWAAYAVANNRPDASQAPGTLGFGDTGLRVKALPVFASEQMPDSKILIAHRELVQYRVLSSKPMTMHGPYQSYHTDGKLIAAQQYYVEEYNATLSLIADKGGYITVS